MAYRLAADAVLVAHLGFILFVVLGGLLALRWRWLPWLHLPAAAWGFVVEVGGLSCPLTGLENHLRVLAGEAGYAESFIEHYLLAAIYPAGLTRAIQYGLAAVVLAVNTAVYAWLVRRRRPGRRP